MHVDHRRGLERGQTERLGLAVAAGDHLLGHRFGHLLQQLVALLVGHVARLGQRVEEDLDVDLVVGAVDAGHVVDRVRVDPASLQRVLDAPGLGQPEIAALPHDSAAEVLAVHPHRVVGLIAGLGIGLVRALHVRTDPAVPEQIDRSAEDGRDQLGRRELIGVDVEGGPDLRGDGDRLDGARVDTATWRDERRVVVAP